MTGLYRHGRISFRPDEELCNMQGNTDRVVVTLAPDHGLILWLQETDGKENLLRSEGRAGGAGPDLSARHQYQLATQVATLAQGLRRSCL